MVERLGFVTTVNVFWQLSEVEPETRIESDSNSEDEEYKVEDESSTDQSKFSDSENELASSENEIFDVNVGLDSDEVEVESENESGQSDSLHSVDDSVSEGGIEKARFPEFNRNSDLSNPRLKAGLIFASKKILKKAIKMYNIKNRYRVKLKRNDNKRIQVKCKGECPCMLWTAPVNGEDPATGSWQIRSVNATDLEIENSHSYTFMTDRQKGLKDAVPELFPYSAHRTCVRHLYSNAKTNGMFIGKVLKDQLWKAARATYVTQFQSVMDELKLILEARDKLIITLIESISTKLMQRLAKRKD
ncbi:hypothetical protein V6N13_106493 [Hibiscus sabdariffa]